MKKHIYFMFFVLFLAGTARAEDLTVGQYSYIEGRVDVSRDISDRASRLHEDAPVFLGDIIRTKSNSRAEIFFNDNTIVRMAPDTRLAIEKYTIGGGNERKEAFIRVYRGKIRAIVAKSGGPAKNFVIATPNAMGEVKGTDLFAFYQADLTGVLVNDGHLSVYNPSFPDDIVEVRKGEFLTIPLAAQPGKCRSAADVELKMHEKDTTPTFSKKMRTGKTADGDEIAIITGRITSVNGDVTLLENNRKTWAAAKQGMIVEEGDTIRTGGNGKIEITLENGNIISLQPNSEIKIHKLRQDTKSGEYDNSFSSGYGKIKAVVEKIGQKSTFQVKTPTAVCAVRGTVMYLDIQAGVTTAFYEGGNGFVTSTISSETTDVGAGENSSADSQGSVTDSTTTSTEDRLGLEELWEAGDSSDGYSSPENNTGLDDNNSDGTGDPSGSDGSTGSNDEGTGTDDGTGSAGEDTGDTGDLLGDTTGGSGTNELIPPTIPDSINDPLPYTPDAIMPFAGGCFGTLGESMNFSPDRATVIDGILTFMVPGIGGRWGGESASGNYFAGTFSNTGYSLWTIDNMEGTASDGGTVFAGAGGIANEQKFIGKILGFYLDPLGYAGVISSPPFEGTATSDGLFENSSAITLQFHPMSQSALSPGSLDPANFETGYLYGDSGYGGFDNKIGYISCSGFSGESINIPNEHWGIMTFGMGGYYDEPISNNWKLALGGTHQGSQSTDPWIVTVYGNRWSSGELAGKFKGFSFSSAGETGVHGTLIFNGDVMGNYSDEGEVFTWQALGGGEWVDITDLLSESNLGFTMSDFNNFVQVPITEVCASIVQGSNCSMSGVMDMHFYQNTDMTRLWAGEILGSHDGSVPSNWVLNLTNDAGHNITLMGDQWQNGEWHATVSGRLPTENIDLSGEAAGHYNENGKFGGIAGGTWNTGGGE